NTDAEGRLTLIDAVDYILTEKKVDYVVDIATLTGAAEVALGQKIAPTVTNDELFYKKLKKASKVTGERTWELPHDEDYLELIKSPYADLTNSGGRFAGTITAGLFIGSVVGETPWIHIDIAGPSWTEKDTGYFSKGATGFGTRLLYQLAKEMSNG
ncbi:MAG: aminopeptidase, partial [Alphaproteobacteria bacterium]